MEAQLGNFHHHHFQDREHPRVLVFTLINVKEIIPLNKKSHNILL